MNFFEHQAHAKRQTGILLFYFFLAVLFIVLGVNLVIHAVVLYSLSPHTLGPPQFWQWLPLHIYFYSTTVTLLIIGTGTLVRLVQLSRGGRAVAELMGGDPVSADTQDPLERRLLNVVEEMAIASGVQIPEVFVMREEPGINAFAAGYSPNEAAVAVTKGALEILNRDELQGVIAHEFSHILNGDMRINIRLMGILNGILVIGAIGGFLLRSQRYARYRSRDSAQSTAAIMGIGLALYVLGYAGIFFGRLIKAAVSRQREFLADASAVQFTRNPSGIAHALKKIYQNASGSLIMNRHTEEMSHMLFGEGVRQINFSQMLATHPPLEKRIQRIDPDLQLETYDTEVQVTLDDEIHGISQLQGGTKSVETDSDTVINSVGQVNDAQVHYARTLLQSMPENIRQHTHSFNGAKAILLSLLASEQKDEQMSRMLDKHSADLSDAVETLSEIHAQIEALPDEYRVPLIDLSVHRLRELTQEEKNQLLNHFKQIIEADEKVTLFEFVLYTILCRQLGPKTGHAPKIRFKHIGQIIEPCVLILSVMAIVGHPDSASRKKAFKAGTTYLDLGPQRLLESGFNLKEVKKALDDLHDLAIMPRMKILKALVETVLDDRQIKTREAEFLRSVAEALDCPVPPIISSADSSSNDKDSSARHALSIGASLRV